MSKAEMTHTTWPAYEARRAAVQRFLKSSSDAEAAEAWAQVHRLADAGLADKRRMRTYLANRRTAEA